MVVPAPSVGAMYHHHGDKSNVSGSVLHHTHRGEGLGSSVPTGSPGDTAGVGVELSKANTPWGWNWWV